MAEDSIDWTKKGGDVVIPTTQGIAIYENQNGDVVVRQEGTLGEDDSIIVIPLCHAKAVAAHIEALVMSIADQRGQTVAAVSS